MTEAERADLEADLALALEAAAAAGRLVMKTFRTDPEVRHKSPDQPVTDADIQADALLTRMLRGARPEYGWLSEETVDRPERLTRRRVWVVDPIDGTRSFIAGYPEFAVSVGLVEDGRALLGVILNPARDETFWAVRGGGAFLRAGNGSPVRLSMEDPGADARPSLLASRSEIRRGELEAFAGGHDLTGLGSTAYKMAGVAAGRGHAFLSRGPKSEWDVAAGVVIVEEAGGAVSDLEGEPLAFNRPNPHFRGLLVAPRRLHAELLAIAAGAATGATKGGDA